MLNQRHLLQDAPSSGNGIGDSLTYEAIHRQCPACRRSFDSVDLHVLQVMHTAVVIEYCLEWVFLLHMMKVHSDSAHSNEPLDQLNQLMMQLAQPTLRY